MKENLTQIIAFHLWLEEKRPEGRALDHWLRAQTLTETLCGTGLLAVAQERAAQIAGGWTAEHDDQHEGKELVSNAREALQSYLNEVGCYAAVPGMGWGIGDKHNANPWKLLTVAGALIAAEIDRLVRLPGVRVEMVDGESALVRECRIHGTQRVTLVTGFGAKLSCECYRVFSEGVEPLFRKYYGGEFNAGA